MYRHLRQLDANFANKKHSIMTLPELNHKFSKAHMLMGIGTAIGAAIAKTYGIRHPLIMGLLTGLLVSIHLYHKCIMVLITEYKRLKTNKHNENENIS